MNTERRLLLVCVCVCVSVLVVFNMDMGRKGIELLQELKRDTQLPPYDEEALAHVAREIDTLNTDMELTAQNPYLDPKDVYTTGNLLFYMNTISRNKRVVLAYLNERLRRVKQMWWDFGGELPPEREEPMHGHETLFFTQYNDLLEEYNFGCGTDISKDMEPPKALHLEVRMLFDVEEFVKVDGSVCKLGQGTTLFLRRNDAEKLVRQGVARHVTH